MVQDEPNFTRNQWRLYNILILTLGALWIVLTALLVPIGTGQLSKVPRPGFKAPDFELTSPTGEPIRLSAFSGKAVVVNFWASWCAPCQAEMPALQSVFDRFHGQGLVILAVNSTFQDDPVVAVDFASSRGLTFPILLDSTGAVSRQYQVRALPTTYFIDRAGMITELAIGGPLNEAFLIAQLESLLTGDH